MPSLLAGVRVIEFGQLVAVPSAGKLLSDLGADVIKVESLTGDFARTMPRPTAGRFDTGSTFLAYNGGKRSVALDLKRSDGVAAARRLVDKSDVLIENLRPGALDAMGLSAALLHESNPRLIYGSVVGYPPGDARAGDRVVDNIAQAHSGIMAATGEEGGPPLRVGFTVVDAAAGLALAQAVSAALFRRERTGVGTRVAIPLIDTGIFLQAAPFAEFLATGREPDRSGNASALAAPSDVFPTADGWIMVVAYLPKDWRRLLCLIGREDLEHDPRFADSSSRLTNRRELKAHLEPAFRARTSAEWIELLGRANLMVGEVRTYDQVVATEGSGGGAIECGEDGRFCIHSPAYVDVGERPGLHQLSVPRLGEHTSEVLLELGYSDEEIELLFSRRAAFGASWRQDVQVEVDTDEGVAGMKLC